MSYEKLKEAILDEAQERADVISKNLQQQQTAEEERIAQEARALEEHIIQQANHDGEQEARRIHQESELAARSEILRAKQQELDEVRKEYIHQMLSLNEDDANQLVKGLLDIIQGQKGILTAGESHVRILRTLSPDTIEVSSDIIPNEGGFIFRSSDTEINLTVSELVKHIFLKRRAEIAKTLFS